MNIASIKENIKLAQTIAQESFGGNPPPEIIAAVLNSITAQSMNEQLDAMTRDLCRAAAVAAGN